MAPEALHTLPCLSSGAVDHQKKLTYPRLSRRDAPYTLRVRVGQQRVRRRHAATAAAQGPALRLQHGQTERPDTFNDKQSQIAKTYPRPEPRSRPLGRALGARGPAAESDAGARARAHSPRPPRAAPSTPAGPTAASGCGRARRRAAGASGGDGPHPPAPLPEGRRNARDAERSDGRGARQSSGRPLLPRFTRTFNTEHSTLSTEYSICNIQDITIMLPGDETADVPRPLPPAQPAGGVWQWASRHSSAAPRTPRRSRKRSSPLKQLIQFMTESKLIFKRPPPPSSYRPPTRPPTASTRARPLSLGAGRCSRGGAGVRAPGRWRRRGGRRGGARGGRHASPPRHPRCASPFCPRR
jgi:hypothetical protein